MAYMMHCGAVMLHAENQQLDSIVTSYDRAVYRSLKSSCFNKSLYDQVTNRNELDKLVVRNNQIIQNRDPIFLPAKGSFLSAHFYAPVKEVFGKSQSTFWVNIIVLWIMTLILAITLYFDLFKYIIQIGKSLQKSIKQ
jgi:hypothetical protein